MPRARAPLRSTAPGSPDVRAACRLADESCTSSPAERPVRRRVPAAAPPCDTASATESAGHSGLPRRPPSQRLELVLRLRSRRAPDGVPPAPRRRRHGRARARRRARVALVRHRRGPAAGAPRAPRRPRSASAATTSSADLREDAGRDGERRAELGDRARGSCATARPARPARAPAAKPRSTSSAAVAERGERSRRAAELGREARVADSTSRSPRLDEPDEPAGGLGPNVVGTACCRSVRAAIGVRAVRLARAGRTPTAAPSSSARTSAQGAAGDEHRRACRRCPGSSRRSGRSRRRPRRPRSRSARTSGSAGLPTARASAASASDVEALDAAGLADRRRRPRAGITPADASARRQRPLGLEHRLAARRASDTARAELVGHEDRVEGHSAKNAVWPLALQPHVEAEARPAPPRPRASRARLVRVDAGEHRIGGVRLRLVGEVHPRQHRLEQAAREHEDSRCGAWPSTGPGLTVTNA